MVEGSTDHLSTRSEADVTRFSVVESLPHFIAEYRSFINSSYRLADLKAGDLRSIGTSATVSQDAGGDEALARFASDLFAEPFEANDIIGEVYRETPPARAPYCPSSGWKGRWLR